MKRSWPLGLLFLILASAGTSSATLTDARLRDNVGIGQISGGDATNPLWEADLGNAEFRVILRNAMDSAGLLENAKGEGRYSLAAQLEKIELPVVALSTKITVRYTLTDRKDNSPVYRETICCDYAMEVWDSIMRLRGLQKLSEGAFRSNAGLLAAELLQLDFFLRHADVP